MAIFKIFGDIYQQDSERDSIEDTTPIQIETFLEKIPVGEEVEILIDSMGGSVEGGISIANIIKKYSDTHKITCHVVGVAASIASVIACAGDKLVLDRGTWLVIHNPWVMTVGNADELKKTIEQLDICKRAILSFYRLKFDLPEEELSRLMDEETWIPAVDAPRFKLNAEVIEIKENAFPIAAKLENFKNKGFKKMPKDLSNEVENLATDSTPDSVENSPEDSSSALENTGTETNPAEETKEERTEEVKAYSETEVNARISGIQASMQKQINDFKSQLKEKEQELDEFKNKSTSLQAALDKVSEELANTHQLLAEKESALEVLNAKVLTPQENEEVLPTFEEGIKACSTPEEKIRFCKSGKWRR